MAIELMMLCKRVRKGAEEWKNKQTNRKIYANEEKNNQNQMNWLELCYLQEP